MSNLIGVLLLVVGIVGLGLSGMLFGDAVSGFPITAMAFGGIGVIGVVAMVASVGGLLAGFATLCLARRIAKLEKDQGRET